MKTSSLFLTLLLSSVFIACESDTVGLTQEQEQLVLDQKRAEIEGLATSVVCNDPSGWTYTGIGGKSCGGPTGYIAYSTSINVSEFLQKVEEFTIAEDNFNKKWNIKSDCSVPPQPIGINCENGQAVLVFP